MTSKEIIVLNELKKHTNHWGTGMNIISEVHQATMGMVDLSQIELRAIIQRLRLEGQPIIASPKGYMLTTNSKDIIEYCNTRRVEIQLELKTLYAMEEKAKEWTNEISK